MSFGAAISTKPYMAWYRPLPYLGSVGGVGGGGTAPVSVSPSRPPAAQNEAFAPPAPNAAIVTRTAPPGGSSGDGCRKSRATSGLPRRQPTP